MIRHTDRREEGGGRREEGRQEGREEGREEVEGRGGERWVRWREEREGGG